MDVQGEGQSDRDCHAQKVPLLPYDTARCQGQKLPSLGNELHHGLTWCCDCLCPRKNQISQLMPRSNLQHLIFKHKDLVLTK